MDVSEAGERLEIVSVLFTIQPSGLSEDPTYSGFIENDTALLRSYNGRYYEILLQDNIVR